MFSIEVRVNNADRVIKNLNRFGIILDDFSVPMREIGKQLTKYYSGPAFLSQGGIFGQKWPSLSPAYQAYKIKHFRTFANQILVRSAGSDAMANKFTYAATKSQVVIGNSAPYFKYHQSNGPRKTKLPRRQMIGVTNNVETLVNEIIKADVAAKIARL